MEIVNRPEHIRRILNKLQDSRRPLVIHVACGLKTREIGQSILLDADQDLILLDELLPLEANKALGQNKTIFCESRIGSVPLQFSSTVTGKKIVDGLPAYRASTPESVEYMQNRAEYRVYISATGRPPVRMVTASGEEYAGRLVDISVSGFGVLLNSQVNLPRNSLIPDIQVQLEDGVILACVARVLHLHDRRTLGKTFAGFEIVDLSSIQTRILRNAIAALQRKNLQIRPGQDLL